MNLPSASDGELVIPMFKTLRARLGLIAALTVLFAWMFVDRGITLGLDLRGGTSLELAVDDPDGALTGAERADAIDRALQIIRTRVNELGVAEPTIQKVGTDRIVVQLPGATQEEQARAKEVIQQAAFLQFQIVLPLTELETALSRMDRAVADAIAAGEVEQAAATPEPGTGVGELFEEVDTGSAQAADTSVSSRPFTSRLQPSGQEGILVVASEDVPAVEQYLALPAVANLIPRGTELLWGFETPETEAQQFRYLYLVEERPLITGEYLEDAQAQRDPQMGQPIVAFQLSRRGGRTFEQGTGEHINDFMAIVLDDQVFSAPTIEGRISDRGQISLPGGTIDEASDLALVLRAGALPAPIRIVEERSVGPSLGADSISAGQLAGIIGLVMVVVIMIGYYRLAGVMAVGALAFYVLLVLGGLAAIDAALTLPGIAGLVLSIGMAVDANVLIFERIREELDAGRSARVAVNEGFSNALSAIIDGQLTTLLTALVLFQFGTGPVQGFAVTLGIGILASLFSAIFITRTFFMLYLDRRPPAAPVSI
jgi:preprotein translocase subunit SecD